MPQTIIPSKDWPWLADVYKVDTKEARVVVLHGSESCPDKIEVFATNHYQAKPMRVYFPANNPEYTVVAGNVGMVYRGPDSMAARDHFRHFRDLSTGGSGRVAGEPVTLMRGDEIVSEYQPKHTVEEI